MSDESFPPCKNCGAPQYACGCEPDDEITVLMNKIQELCAENENLRKENATLRNLLKPTTKIID